MSDSLNSPSSIIKLDSIWFNRYADINYSVSDWYIAILRRLKTCQIFDEYFRADKKMSDASFPMLHHAGNKKCDPDSFNQTLKKTPNDRVFQVHALLQVYYRHNLITADIASELREEYSSSDNAVIILKQKLSIMLNTYVSEKDNNNALSVINEPKYKIHRTEKEKTSEFINTLILIMSNLDCRVEELKKEHFDTIELSNIELKIIMGDILTISIEDHQMMNTSESRDAPPVTTHTIFDLIRLSEDEPKEHVQAVSQMFIEGEIPYFTRHLKQEMHTGLRPDIFDNQKEVEMKVLSSTSPSNLLHDELQTFGWGKSKSDDCNTAPEITHAICSVDLTCSEGELIYSFASWLKRQKNFPANAKWGATVSLEEIDDNIDKIIDDIKKMRSTISRITKRLGDYKYRKLLCYLDYTILCLLNPQRIEIDDNTKKDNDIYKLITDATQKNKYISLVRSAMSEEHLKELKRLVFHN